MIRRVALTLFLVLLSPAAFSETIFDGYEWRELGEGVYLHTRTDPYAGPVDGNSIVIINERDVFVVDTHINPAAARAVLEKIQTLTDNPVTHVINTHWHDDHANGNYIYQDAFPDVKIIAHPSTSAKLTEEWEEFENQRRAAYDAVTVDRILEAADAAEADNPSRAIGLRVYAGYVEALKPELPTLRLAYPNEQVEKRLELNRGARKIIIKWIGRGNTDGDLIVWLPSEKILITGDILVAPIPYAFDSPMIDWVKTLKTLRAFNADIIVPGHGLEQNDRTYLDSVIGLLEATVAEVKRVEGEGVGFDGLSATVDLGQYKERFTGDDAMAAQAWDSYFFDPGLKSAWVSLGFPIPESE